MKDYEKIKLLVEGLLEAYDNPNDWEIIISKRDRKTLLKIRRKQK